MRESLSDKLSEKLDCNQRFVSHTMQRQFAESALKIRLVDITQRLAKLDETNRRVVDVADETYKLY